MNSSNSNSNSGGWKASALRETLNGTIYNSLSIKNNIKKVKKDYISTYNVASTQQTEDYLWLLSGGEIWRDGWIPEGKQYEYYKKNLGSTSDSSLTDITKKPNAKNSNWWWLRSPHYRNSTAFYVVYRNGDCYNYDAKISGGVAPGFSI